MKFHLLSATNHGAFADLVNEHTQNGWALHGPPIIFVAPPQCPYNYTFFQVVTREEKQPGGYLPPRHPGRVGMTRAANQEFPIQPVTPENPLGLV